MITIHVLLFGHYKDAAPPGGTLTLALPSGATIADAARRLGEQNSRLVDLLERARVAVNAEFAGADTALFEGDEVAFLPPMSGG